MAPNQYTRISGNREDSCKYESDLADVTAAPPSRWLVPSTKKKLPVIVAVTVFTLSIFSFSIAAFQFVRSRSNQLPTVSSEEADLFFKFRYTTDLASQDSYRDQHNRWQTASGEWLSCGHSPHEAIERGCHFDIMAAVWLPPPCYNETFAKEVAAIHHSNATTLEKSPKNGVSMTNFTWHSDDSLSPESYIPLEHLPQFFVEKYDRGEKLLAYSIENFHVAHCLYMFRAALHSLERVAAGEKNVYVHEEAMGRPHSKHCQNVMMNYEKWKNGVVELEFGMGWCRKVS